MGEFEQAVLLAILHLDSDAYGVEIRRLISERTGRDVAIGAVYTTLERLRRKGYVSHRVGEPTPERGGRAKKFYDVTPGGREALRSARDFMRRMSRGLGDAELVSGEERGR
jgi:DNA-binding PadR family transcriptional regulator